jgi:hypothetical protein
MPEGFGGINLIIGTAGDIENISIEARLDLTYGKMFAAATAKFQSDPENYAPAIEALVLGCLWLEAVSNRVLHQVLEKHVPTASSVLWRILARQRFLEKIQIISSFHPEVSQTSPNLGSNLGAVFQLRNKLVHFKEEETVIAERQSLDEFLKDFPGDYPDHPLIAHLRQPKIDPLVHCVQDGVHWLEAVYERVSPNAEKQAATESAQSASQDSPSERGQS